MGSTYTNTVGHESVMAQIQRRMTAVDLETLKSPTRPIGEKDHVVGSATEEIKRLFGAWHAVADEHNALVRESGMILEEIQTIVCGGFAALSELFGGKFREHQPKVATLEEMQATIPRLRTLHEIAGKMLWLEVECSFPELQGKPSKGFFSDWKICWFEPTISDIAGDMFGEELPEEVRSMLKGFQEGFHHQHR